MRTHEELKQEYKTKLQTEIDNSIFLSMASGFSKDKYIQTVKTLGVSGLKRNLAPNGRVLAKGQVWQEIEMIESFLHAESYYNDSSYVKNKNATYRFNARFCKKVIDTNSLTRNLLEETLKELREVYSVLRATERFKLDRKEKEMRTLTLKETRALIKLRNSSLVSTGGQVVLTTNPSFAGVIRGVVSEESFNFLRKELIEVPYSNANQRKMYVHIENV